ncbi:Uncharacterised protein [Klebsiella pneumoniae]|nr:Uncharacterised protein [Klebsiella pneumoniae]
MRFLEWNPLSLQELLSEIMTHAMAEKGIFLIKK